MKFDRDKIRNLMPGRDKSSWFEITVKASHAEVRIYDEISWFGITAEDFAEEISNLDVDTMTVRINSPGGSVFDGIAIYNALAQHRARITTQVDGAALSAASFIAQAGDHRVMLRHSQMMIHDAQGFAMGDAKIMHEMADLLEKQNGIIAGIYADRAPSAAHDEAHFAALMSAETWFTDREAVDKGLADEVVNPRSDTNDQATNSYADADQRDPQAVDKPVDWSELFKMDDLEALT